MRETPNRFAICPQVNPASAWEDRIFKICCGVKRLLLGAFRRPSFDRPLPFPPTANLHLPLISENNALRIGHLGQSAALGFFVFS